METKNDPVLELADGWKKVTYFGYELIVPDWVKYLAIDANHMINGFDSNPYMIDGYWTIKSGFIMDELPEFNITDFDWRETLREV